MSQAVMVGIGDRKIALVGVENSKSLKKNLDQLVTALEKEYKMKVAYTVKSYCDSNISYVIFTKPELKDKPLISDLIKALDRKDHYLVGTILDYPPCCIQHFTQDPDGAAASFIKDSIEKDLHIVCSHHGELEGFLKIRRGGNDRQFYVSDYIPYVPCSTHCKHTLNLVDHRLSILSQLLVNQITNKAKLVKTK